MSARTARQLAALGVAGVVALRTELFPELPDRHAATQGALDLLDTGRLDRRLAVPLVPALWAAWMPWPTRHVDGDVWRELWAVAGPTRDGRPWPQPSVGPLLRAARDERTARGWSWTTVPAVARFHAEGAQHDQRRQAARRTARVAHRGARRRGAGQPARRWRGRGSAGP